MSISYVSAELQRAVRLRANHRCEYCGIHEDDTDVGCEVDHILSEKHLGKTDFDNLALACFFCNGNKGSDIGSIRSCEDPEFIPFYNPRIDNWFDHFEIDVESHIVPITDIGHVTARIPGFNTDYRILERQTLRE